MEHRLQIQQHVNLADEAYLIFFMWMNKDSFEEDRRRNESIYETNPEFYQRKCNLIMEITDSIKERFQDRKDKLEYYFKEYNNDLFSYAALAVLWDFHNPSNSLIPYEKRIEGLSEINRLQLYATIVDNENTAGISEDSLKNLADLIAFLDTSTYSNEVKWEVLKIFQHQKQYYDEVNLLLMEAEQLIKNQYGERIAALEQEVYSYWCGVQEREGILDLFRKKLSVTWNSGKVGTIVRPILFNPFSVSISVNLDEEDSWDVLRIGVLLDERFILGNKKLNKEEVVNLGKLLSDKSKVDILEMTSQKPCYGKELANELGLTTATISYHVNALLKMGFLKVEVDANKVYYSIHKENVARYLNDVTEYFKQL